MTAEKAMNQHGAAYVRDLHGVLDREKAAGEGTDNGQQDAGGGADRDGVGGQGGLIL